MQCQLLKRLVVLGEAWGCEHPHPQTSPVLASIYKKGDKEILNIYFYLYILRHLRVRVDFHIWMDAGAKSPHLPRFTDKQSWQGLQLGMFPPNRIPNGDLLTLIVAYWTMKTQTQEAT